PMGKANRASCNSSQSFKETMDSETCHLIRPTAQNKTELEQLCRRPLTARLSLATPVGRVLLEACPVGLHSLTMTDPESRRPCMRLKPGQLASRSAPAVAIADDQPNATLTGPARLALAWLAAYFAANSTTPLPPQPTLCATAAAPPGSFRRRVWRALASSVPPGAVVSYQQLAAMSGAGPGAARAVGSAMRANPVPLLVPCHRVVRSDGSAGRFAGGKADATKRWLLEHERVGFNCR
ncbi:hypothetical protein BOX15_Mlig006543g2, partial [Macrostomum lignano]